MVVFCKFCGSDNTKLEVGAVSPFFAIRALGQKGASSINLVNCKNCYSRWFDIDVSDSQLYSLYKNYRGVDYFQLRNKYEPWYSSEINKSLKVNYTERRKGLLTLLKRCGVSNEFEEVLDHGGDKGQLVTGIGESVINSKKRYVYDISGVGHEEDVESINALMLRKINPDFILSCHVIEHLPSPLDYLRELVSIGTDKTLYYIEAPRESYFSLNSNWLPMNFFVRFISKHQWLFKFFHLSSILFRRLFRFLPPPLFHVLNEHLNFISLKGLEGVVSSAGLAVKSSGSFKGSIFVLAKKKSDENS